MTGKIIEEPAYRERTFIFRDRFHAGQLLAKKLQKYTANRKVIVLAVPAGGVPVGYTIAKELCITMDVIIVRKLQIPWNTEAGFGALAWDGETVLNRDLVSHLRLTGMMIGEAILKTRKLVFERMKRYRGDKPLPDLRGKVVILVDDGLASGFTMLAAARSVRKREPEKVVIAVPTASAGAIKRLAAEVDETICLNVRSGPIFAVADAYMKWYDLTDEEVTDILEKTDS